MDLANLASPPFSTLLRNRVLIILTDPAKPDLVGYFALPGRILTSLALADYIKNPWSILFLPGVEFSYPGEACSPARKRHELVFEFHFLFLSLKRWDDCSLISSHTTPVNRISFVI